MVKNLPAMLETWVRSLGQIDPLEKGMVGYPLQYSCPENPVDRGSWQTTVHGVSESDRTELVILRAEILIFVLLKTHTSLQRRQLSSSEVEAAYIQRNFYLVVAESEGKFYFPSLKLIVHTHI